MYKDFFELRAYPFNVNPDPRYLVLTTDTEEALACLTYGIESRKGFVLLTGEVGTGKTMLLNKLKDWLDERRMPYGFVFNTCLTVPQFFEFLVTDFGIRTNVQSKSETLLSFYHWLLERYRAGETPVLIVDEAQNLSETVLEEIRLLSNLETSTDKLLQIVLVGQPELERTLQLPQLRQLWQRIVLKAKTRPLSPEDTKHYVEHRLELAGSNGQKIFEPLALSLVHRYSRGVPRQVNLICDHCLVEAFIEGRKTVSPEIVQAIVRDQELDITHSPTSLAIDEYDAGSGEEGSRSGDEKRFR